jgi:hypothetical protein
MTERAQCAAWDAYRALTTGLLPALHHHPVDSEVVKSQLGGVATRIVRYAPLWGEHGTMLIAALHSAMRLYRTADTDDLADLLQHISDRLYILSATTRRLHHGTDDAATT